MSISDNIFASNLNAVCHVGGFYSIKKGVEWKMDASFFGQNKFYYIKGGSCKITIKGKTYEGIPGRWFLIPAGVLHSYTNDTTKAFCKHWMHFDLYPENMNFFSDMKIPYYVDVPKNSKADKLFKEYFTYENTDSMTGMFKGKATLLNLIAEYVHLAVPDMKIKADNDAMVSSVLRFIDDNMEQNISIEQLANVCHLHPTHFIRVFKKKTGETPGKFLQLRKMETAKKLIEETNIPISEIMSRVGIVDAAQFAKKFRIFFGNSPRAYRKDIRGMMDAFKKSHK